MNMSTYESGLRQKAAVAIELLRGGKNVWD